MTIKINGTAKPELERIILQKVETNRQNRPDILKKIENRNDRFLNFLLDIFKVGK